jgi:hypothetical protein
MVSNFHELYRPIQKLDYFSMAILVTAIFFYQVQAELFFKNQGRNLTLSHLPRLFNSFYFFSFLFSLFEAFLSWSEKVIGELDIITFPKFIE